MGERIVRSWLTSGLRRRLAGGRRPSNNVLRLLVGTTFADDMGLADRARRELGAYAAEPVVCMAVVDALIDRRPLTRAAVGLVLTPMESTTHTPQVALIRWLESSVSWHIAQRLPVLLDAALSHADPEVRGRLRALFADSDHLELLGVIENEFTDKASLGSAHPIVALVEATPHLPRPEADAWTRVQISLARRDVGALRADISRQPGPVIGELLALAMRSPNPAWQEASRTILADLPAGEGRDELCRRAGHGDALAISIVTSTGYRPSAYQLPVFYFATEQWALYDELDPDGALLAEICHRDPDGDVVLKQRVQRLAEQTGRPDPYPARSRST